MSSLDGKHRILLRIAGPIAVVAMLFFIVTERSGSILDRIIIELQAPSFVTVASAAPDDIGSILDSEAGISAYFQSPDPIVLDDVRGVFRTIETETPEYIIGSVPVPNYDNNWDVHVYVHISGWVLAYYPQLDPVGRIMDWRSAPGQNLTTTILENALGVIASAAGVPFSSGTYYHFRYPNATHLMLIMDSVCNGWDSFVVNIPSSFDFYERSWSRRYTASGGLFQFYLDGVLITGGNYGIFTAAQFSPDVDHTLSVRAGSTGCTFGGLALTYRIP